MMLFDLNFYDEQIKKDQIILFHIMIKYEKFIKLLYIIKKYIINFKKYLIIDLKEK